jgi:hypothetical protein
MGYAMRLFGHGTRKDLNIIRRMRNQFAHSRRPIEFVTPVVKTCCDELVYPTQPNVFVPFNYLNKVSDERLEDASDRTHPRTRFFISCHEITQRIFFIRGGQGDEDRNQLI